MRQIQVLLRGLGWVKTENKEIHSDMKSWKKDFGDKDKKNDVQHKKSKTKLKFQLYSGM